MNKITFPPFPSDPIRLPKTGNVEPEVHVLDKRSYDALKAATFSNRPLLVRGDPGVGKTQLARAAAELLKRPLVHQMVDSRTEPRDLLWTFDAISRLAEAQISSATDEKKKDEVRKRLEVRNFIRPGPLWWAFCWESALEACEGFHDSSDENADGKRVKGADQLVNPRCPWRIPGGWNPNDGCVVLLDEMDKAESDVPNGLLEALANRSFLPQAWPAPIEVSGVPPLIIITTNEERVLPDAFVRRCLVLSLELPEDEKLAAYLVTRGRAHFCPADNVRTTDVVLAEAAKMLVAERRRTRDVLKERPLPGQAEYLDLVRAAIEFSKKADRQKAALAEISDFFLQKHQGKKR